MEHLIWRIHWLIGVLDDPDKWPDAWSEVVVALMDYDKDTL